MTDALAILALALRAILPAGAGVGAARAGDPALPPPWPGEDAGEGAVPARRAEFAAGRAAARAALAAAGLPPAAIPRRPDRAPAFPPGLAGSVTHAGGVALAAVLPGAGGLGIDLEPAGPLPPGVATLILSPAESLALPPGPLAPLAAFAAKEALYKAQYALSGQLFGFDGADLRLAPDLTAFTARLTLPVAGIPPDAVLSGRLAQAGGFMLAALVL
jgi:4'-phosphopantetheinyl transferase EntD